MLERIRGGERDRCVVYGWFWCFCWRGVPGTRLRLPQLHSAVETYPRVSLTQQQMQLVYSGVQRVLSDPNSARFSDINAGRQPDGTLYVCGSVDTRNVSGNYTGNQPFFGTLDGRGLHADHHRGLAGAAAFDPRLLRAAARAQLALSPFAERWSRRSVRQQAEPPLRRNACSGVASTVKPRSSILARSVSVQLDSTRQ